jgi:hypothetical protein
MEMTIFCLLAIVSSLYQTAEGKSAKVQTMNGIGVQCSTDLRELIWDYESTKRLRTPCTKTTYWL